jgi:hypothetical protein
MSTTSAPPGKTLDDVFNGVREAGDGLADGGQALAGQAVLVEAHIGEGQARLHADGR